MNRSDLNTWYCDTAQYFPDIFERFPVIFYQKQTD